MRVVSQIVSKEQMEYEIVGENKNKFESYIKRNLMDRLTTYGDGIQEDMLYMFVYEKVVDNKYEPNMYRYEIRVVPIERINPHTQKIS